MTDTRDINNQGQIVGNNGQHALLYSGGQVTDLNTLGGTWSEASAINDSGQVTGTSEYAVGYHYPHAFLYSGSQMKDLGAFPGGNGVSRAYGINNAGQVVGVSSWPYGEVSFLYSNGTLSNFWPLTYGHSAVDINNAGQIVLNVPAPFFTACYLYSAGVPKEVGRPGGLTGSSIGTALNESGHVVGWFSTTSGALHAFLYDGHMQDLGTLGGFWSKAYDINNNGEVLGDSATTNGAVHPFLYRDGVMIDLTTRTPGAQASGLGSAVAMNDHGQILCSGGRLLTPCPELAIERFEWAITPGALMFVYTNLSIATTSSTTAKLFWANGAGAANRLSDTPMFLHSIPAGFAGGSGPVIVPASTVQSRPTNATHVVLVLNPENQLLECTTNNNTASINLTQPDLLAGVPAWNPANSGLSFAYTVQPGTTARASTTAQLFWANGTAISNKVSGAIFTHNIPASFGGQSSNIVVAESVFNNPPANATHVLLVVDSPNVVVESSENNNTAAAVFPRPDLAPVYFRWSASPQEIEFSYTVQTGRTAIAATTAKLFWANGGAASNVLSGTALFNANIPSGASGPSPAVIVSAANLQNPPATATHVVLILDPDNLVAEGNETNNGAAVSIAQPDLFPTSFNWRVRGGGLDFSYTVRTGFVAIAATTAKIYWANGVALSNVLSGTPVFTTNIPAGAAGPSPILHVPAARLLSPPGGATYFLLVLDEGNAVLEGNETNNLRAIEYEQEPTELKGRVLDAVDRAPIGGATVTVGEQSSVTSATGDYVIGGVRTVITNVLVVTAEGYSTNRTRIIVPPRQRTKVVPDIFLAPDGAFVVTAIEPKYNGLFLSAASLVNEYTAKVVWADRTPGRVDFYVNDVLTQSVPTTDDEAKASLDMGLFQGLQLGINKVTAVAVDNAGASSPPFDQSVTIIPAPPLVYPLLGVLAPFQFFDESDPGYSFEIAFPANEIGSGAWRDLSFLGRFGEEIGFGGRFNYKLNSGHWEASFGLAPHGKWFPKGTASRTPKLLAGEKTLEAKAYGTAEGTATQTDGVIVTNLSFEVSFDYNQKLGEVPLSRILPTVWWLKLISWLTFAGADMSSLENINIYFQVGAKAELEGDARSRPVKYKDTSFEISFGPRASYEPDFFGIKGEITVGGKLKAEFKISPEFDFERFEFLLYGKLGLTVRGRVAIDTGEFVIVKLPDDSSYSLSDGSRLSPGWQFVPLASKTPQPRGYLEGGTEVFIASPKQNRFSLLGRSPAEAGEASTPKKQDYEPSDLSTGQADLTLIENIYADSYPAVAARGAEVMLVYVSDSGTTNTLNYTDIKWTRWDGTNWSPPQAIRTNSQAEFCPQVRFDGNGDAIAVWERVANPNLTNEDLTVMLSQLEIVWSRWTRTDGTWSEPIALSTNNFLDRTPRLCGPLWNGDVLCVWTKNEANLLIGGNLPTNDVAMWSEWQPGTHIWSVPQVLLDSSPYRFSDSLEGSSNCAVYAWAADSDGVLTNQTDQEIFCKVWTNGVWGTAQRVTSNNIPDRSVRAQVSRAGEPMLIWQSGTNLVFNRGLSATNRVVRYDTQSTGFADYAATLGPSNHLVVIWQEMSTNGYDPHYVVYDPTSDTWGNDDLLLNDPPRDRSFAAVWDDVGNLIVAYNKVHILYKNKTVTLTNGETLVIPNVPEAGRVDLAVTKRALVKDLALSAGDFTVEGTDYLPGDQLTLSAAVRNSGNLALSNVVVDFFSGDPAAGGLLVASSSATGWLAAATSAVISVVWIVPEPATNHTLYAVANPTGLANEFNPANNTASVRIGGTDLAVGLVSKAVETNGSLRIIAQVQNLGAPSATNCTLSLWRGNSAPLTTAAVPSLRPGRTAELALQLPAGTHAPGESFYTLSLDEARMNSDVETNNNQTTFAVMLWLDSDADGMSDHWEIANGLSRYDAADALADPDQDGLSNLEEYQQNKNPLAFDNLRVVTGRRLPNGHFQLTAFVERGRSYILEASTNLVDWESLQAFAATNSPVTLVDSTSSNRPRRFYRLHLSDAQLPRITGQPASSTNKVGSLVSFVVIADGSTPLGYQWRKDGVNVVNGASVFGATRATLSMAPADFSHAGVYEVVVTNAHGATTSQIAALTITTNELLNGLLAWLPFDGDTLDASGSGRPGTNQGVIFDVNRLGEPGRAGRFSAPNYVQVNHLDPDLQTNGFSFGGWIRFDAHGGVLSWTHNGDWGSTYVFSLGNNTLYCRVGTGSPATSHDGFTAAPPLGQWSHFFVTHSLTNDTFYLNGQPVGQWASYPMAGNVDYLRLGEGNGWTSFTGLLDDFVVYGRQLSSNEVGRLIADGLSFVTIIPPEITFQPRSRTNLLESTVNFEVRAKGTAPLQYRWRKNGAVLNDSGRVAGTASPTLTVTAAQLSDAGAYDVVITNYFDAVTSQVAVLSITTNMLRNGLLAWLPFNGDTLDASGNDRHGINTGVTFTTNRIGETQGAAAFLSGRSVRVNNLDPDLQTNGFSFGGWVRFDVLAGVMLWTHNGDWGSTYLYSAANNYLYFRVGTGNPATSHDAFTNAPPLGQWTHLFVTHNPTNDKFYFNGQLVGQWPSYPMTYNVDYLTLGEGAGFQGFSGALDEVLIYGRELSAFEVGQIYQGVLNESAVNAKLAVVSVTPATVNLSLKGTPGSTWYVQRAPSLLGTWTILGSVVLNSSGTGSFPDNSPLPGAAFYRVRSP